MKRHMLFKRTAFVLVVSLLTQIGLAPAWAQPPAGEVVYYHTDMVGSVRMVTDEGGAAIEQYNYTPFGVVLGGQVPGAAQPRGYAGKERDAETGNDYFGARFYASQIGRFTTVDPVLDLEQALLEPQSWNRYTYSLNNPLKFTDPDGRNPVLVGGIIGAGVFAGWRAYQNYRHGRAWHENIGVEASKGFLIGATLGLAAPAVAGRNSGTSGGRRRNQRRNRHRRALRSSRHDRHKRSGQGVQGRGADGRGIY